MAVETHGKLWMWDDDGPGVAVHIYADAGRLRLVTANEVAADWQVHGIGIHALDDRLEVKAGGDLFILKAEKDAELAVELGIVAASPRLARRMSALHKPEDLPPVPAVGEEVEEGSQLVPMAYGLSGVLVLVGGALVRAVALPGPLQEGRTDLWPAFVIGGLLMMMVAIFLALRARLADVLAYLVLTGVIVAFVLLAMNAVTDPAHLTAYAFVAGGLVVGVAVMVGGDRGQLD